MDSPESIRSASEERRERLEALAQLRGTGVLSDGEYEERRRELVHAHFHGPECSHGSHSDGEHSHSH